MKSRQGIREKVAIKSLPAWGAWVEINWITAQMDAVRSLPAWGAWVEISKVRHLERRTISRSPHGERGLKFILKERSMLENMSLPAWGAWVEM